MTHKIKLLIKTKVPNARFHDFPYNEHPLRKYAIKIHFLARGKKRN